MRAKLTSTYNSDTMSVGSRGLDVVTSLKEILLPQQGLGHDREDSPQTGGGNEVIILEFCGLGTALTAENLGDLALLIDRLDRAPENADVVGRLLQGGNVLVLDPALFGVGLIGKGQWSANEMVLWKEHVLVVANLAEGGRKWARLTEAISLVHNSNVNGKVRTIMGSRSAVKGSLLGIRTATGSAAAADVLQVEGSGETAVRTTNNENLEGRPRHGGVVNGNGAHCKSEVCVVCVCV